MYEQWRHLMKPMWGFFFVFVSIAFIPTSITTILQVEPNGVLFM